MDDDDGMMFAAAASLAALGAGVLTKRVLSNSWTKRRGAVPGNPLDGDTSWGEAIAFAAVSGVLMGVVRLLAQRGVVAVFDARKAGAAAANAAKG